MKNKFVSLLLVVCLAFAFAIPVYAGPSDEKTITVKVGSTEMKVNGQTVKINAPFAASGATMVPMAVFTKGLGAKLTLKNNKEITLTYPKFTVVITVGSKTATVNGKKLALAAAPVLKAGVTFAPLKLLQSFGAKLKPDPAGKEFTITIATADTGKDSAAGIDSDAGKTKIGDSFYQWSMNYPTGLAQDYQTDDGSGITFVDVKNEYYLGINVATAKNELTAEEKRTLMSDYLGDSETALDKSSIQTGSLTYERIISKGKNGFFYENRGFQANGKFYVVVFGKKTASKAELAKASGILDTFQTGFDRNDKSIKDLSKIVRDAMEFKNADYGLSVTLPKTWSEDRTSSFPLYHSDDEKGSLLFRISSLTAGDTLDAWVNRRLEIYGKLFTEAYRKPVEKSAVTWNGVPATMVKLTYSLDTVTWWEEYEIYTIQGNYRYYTELSYPTLKQELYGSLNDSILQSMKIDTKVIERDFGNIPDETDWADWTQTSKKTSEKYGYSVTLPKHWTGLGNDLEKSLVTYSSIGVIFNVAVFEDLPDPQSFIDEMLKEVKKNAESSSKYKIIENTKVTYVGKEAVKLVVEDTRNVGRNANLETAYIFEYKGSVYMVGGVNYLANATDFLKGQLADVIHSFQLQP